ncbi:MAG: hypothetical protein MI923_20545 [Phycisphaerales bacterium]|nr:hypothetical protein [Phycisphaerales bacterium]
MKIKLALAFVCVLTTGSWTTTFAGARQISKQTEQDRGKKQVRKGSKSGRRAGPVVANRTQRKQSRGKIVGRPALALGASRPIKSSGAFFSSKANKRKKNFAVSRNRGQAAHALGASAASEPVVRQTKTPTNNTAPTEMPSLDQALAKLDQLQNNGQEPKPPIVQPVQSRDRKAVRESRTPAPPIDEWGDYVIRVSQKYGFTEAQNARAMSILKDLRNRALQYRTRKGLEFIKCEKIQDKTARNARLKELNRPIDLLFNELKLRLENLPTIPQWHRAQNRLSMPG